MTDASSSDYELIDRYLAGRLTDAEALMTETRIVEDPAFRSEVELTAAFKEGFRELERRQQLSSILTSQSESWVKRRPFAIAALSLIVAVALSWIVVGNRDDDSREVIQTAALYFEHTRGSESHQEVVWQRGKVSVRLELHLDVGADPASAYEVTISSVGGNAPRSVLSSVVPTKEDGQIVAEVNDRLLAPGSYLIILRPLESAGGTQSIAYELTVR